MNKKVLIYNLSSFWVPVPCSNLRVAGSEIQDNVKTCNTNNTFEYAGCYFAIFSPLNYYTNILEKLDFEKNL